MGTQRLRNKMAAASPAQPPLLSVPTWPLVATQTLVTLWTPCVVTPLVKNDLSVSLHSGELHLLSRPTSDSTHIICWPSLLCPFFGGVCWVSGRDLERVRGREEVKSPWVCMLSRSGMFDSCDPMDWSPPGSFVHGIFQARILVATSYSRGIFPAQGSNLCLLPLLNQQVVLYHRATWKAPQLMPNTGVLLALLEPPFLCCLKNLKESGGFLLFTFLSVYFFKTFFGCVGSSLLHTSLSLVAVS